MRITLHQLKVFSTLAETLNATRAAQVLHMTQPAVSIQVKQLEDYYKVKLFEVVGKKIYLTAYGQELSRAYKDIHARLENVKTLFSEWQGCVSGKLSLATVSTAKYFVPHLLGKFKQSHTNIEVVLKVTNRENVIDRLKNNMDDFVIMSQLPTDVMINAIPMLQDELVIAASPKHALALKKQISLKDLKDELFLAREPGSGTRMVMENIFKKYKINPAISMELGSSEAIKQAVIANMGLSLLSRMSIEQECKLKRIAILNVIGFPLRHLWYAVYLKNKTLSPVANRFLKEITSFNAMRGKAMK